MDAIICTEYGTADVLKLQDVAKPQVKEHELLIKIHASVVTPADCAFRKGEPFILKLMYGLKKPKYPILGVEFAGEVVAVGKEAALFQVGDRVFGVSPDTLGAYAEYMCVSEKAPIASIPDEISYEEAVAVADGALTSLVFLRDKAALQRGQKVLINGASGAVGVYGVQLAKWMGADVTGVCSGANVEMVIGLGADRVIDYTKDDFTQGAERYDVIFDAVGKSSFARCKGVLAEQGIYMGTVPTVGILFQMVRTGIFGRKRKKALFAATGLNQNKDNLNLITELMTTGTIKAVIDRRYPLSEMAEAHRYVDKGHKKGNVIIKISHPNTP